MTRLLLFVMAVLTLAGCAFSPDVCYSCLPAELQPINNRVVTCVTPDPPSTRYATYTFCY
jgi:hypothetical protein